MSWRPSRLTRLLVVALGLFPAARASAQAQMPQLRIVVPSGPGGAWDLTARVLQPTLQAEGLARTTTVENIAGAGGVVGLTRFAMAERGSDNVLLVVGNGLIGAAVSSASAVTLADVTPIARLSGECEVLIVPAQSALRSVADLIRSLRAEPATVSWGVGGPGGTDAITAWLVADAVGVEPKRVNIIPVAGGGEVMRVVLGSQVTVGVNPLTPAAPYITAGTVRALAVSCAERVPGVDAPTLREAGVDVELEAWRALVAPPGITPAARARLEALATRLVRAPAWRDALEKYAWRDRFLTGAPLARFLSDEQTRIRDIVRRVGTTASEARSFEAYPAVVVVATLAAALAFAVQRRRSPAFTLEAPGAGWPAVGLVGVGSSLSVLLIERAGFVPAAMALFWTTARAFDRRHPIRDAAWALVLSTTAYIVFAKLLGLPLPAGVLGRWF